MEATVIHVDFSPNLATKKGLARDLLEKACWIDDEDPEEGIHLYRRAIHLDPSLDIAMTNLGRIYFSVGDFGAAETWWTRSMNTNPRAVDAYYNLGYLRLMQREYQSAISHFEMAIAVEPTFANAYFNLGEALGKLGRPQEARVCWKKHIELRGEYTEGAWAALGFRVIQGGL